MEAKEPRKLWGYKEDCALHPYEITRDYALDELLDEPSMESITLTEYREPGFDDVPDMLTEVIELMQEVIGEDERLHWSNGSAYLNMSTQSPEAIALRTAMDAYIAAHIDFSSSAWIPTGVEEVLTRAAMIEGSEA